MKNTVNIKTGIIGLFFVVAFLMIPNSSNAQATETAETVFIKVEVDGLSCPFCAYGLEKKIKKIETAKDIKIELEEGELTFNVKNSHQPTKDELTSIVKDAGFTPKEIHFSKIAFKEKTND